MNSRPTPRGRTLRGKIDPADSENDNESVDYDFIEKSLIFNEFDANSALANPTGEIDPVDSENDNESLD